jgi:hypothetical protein
MSKDPDTVLLNRVAVSLRGARSRSLYAAPPLTFAAPTLMFNLECFENYSE